MSNLEQIKLGSVQETLLLPLWGRALETQKKQPKLIDQKAVEIINSVGYDFTTIAKNINKLSLASWISRSIYFDNKIRNFIQLYNNATVVNIGCGLDTTFDRIDNGKIQWLDIDLPDVIELRKNYIDETPRRKFIADSIFNQDWYDAIKNKDHVMFMIAGVLYYFDESEIKKVFYNFINKVPGVEVVFDYSSVNGIKIANKKVIDNGGMNKAAYLKWGIQNIHDLEKWGNNIKVLDDLRMFGKYKKQFPFYKRIGMNISDMIRVMSLAHVRVG